MDVQRLAVGLAILGLQLDSVILKVFSHLNILLICESRYEILESRLPIFLFLAGHLLTKLLWIILFPLMPAASDCLNLDMANPCAGS